MYGLLSVEETEKLPRQAEKGTAEALSTAQDTKALKADVENVGKESERAVVETEWTKPEPGRTEKERYRMCDSLKESVYGTPTLMSKLEKVGFRKTTFDAETGRLRAELDRKCRTES